MPRPEGGEEVAWDGAPRVGADPFTRFPHRMLDRLLPQVSPAEWKVVSVLARKTYGWEREGDQISSRQFALLTGMDRVTVRRALVRLAEADIIRAERQVRSDGGDDTTLYRFRYEGE